MFITLENVVEKVTYTQFEIIFWYSALALTIIIFIIYLTTKKSSRKKLSSLIDDLEKKLLLLEKPNNKKDLSLKINLCLSRLESLFMDLKEKTRLADFDSLISLKEELSIEIKEASKSHDFNELIKKLHIFIDKVKTLEIYVK